MNYSEQEIKNAHVKVDQILKEISEKFKEIETISDKYALRIQLNNPCRGIKYLGKGYHPGIDPEYDPKYDDDYDPLNRGEWVPSRICYG